MINQNTLKEVLSIPSYSGSEQLVREYVVNFAKTNNLDYYVDDMGNVYITKGVLKEDTYYPCVVAHMDTVHVDQYELIKQNKRLDILTNLFNDKTILTARYPNTTEATGIGGDDKCGVYICLEMLKEKECIKAAFFVSEEVGMLGSKVADPNFFKDVGYAIQFDAPTGNWFSVECSGTKLWTEEFESVVRPLLESDGVTNFSYDPFTDVVQLKQKFDFCCAVMFSGYYRQHSKNEYVVIEDVDRSLRMGSEMIDRLGNKKFFMLYDKIRTKKVF
jgi:tripeptide aminopeptidase